MSDRATIAPDSTASPRVATRLGAVVKVRTPPMVQLAADAASSAHAACVRPDDLTAATARLTAAIPLATPSPMSSIAMVVLSPPSRKAVQMRKRTEATRASAAATANRLHSGERAARRRKLEIIRVVLPADG